MTIIQKILNKESIPKDTLLTYMRHPENSRYIFESIMLGDLAIHALNKPKNKVKPNFEDLSFSQIYKLLVQEVSEFEQEIFDLNRFGSRLKAEIDKEKTLEELADVAGCLVGLLAKIISEIEK